jgi:hypothetical protein
MRTICAFWTTLLFVCLLAEVVAAPDLDIFPAPKGDRVAVVLTQPGCPPCAQLKKELAGKTFKGFTVEYGSARDRKWKAKAAPTVVKTVAGKEVDRREGYLSAKDLEAWMAK